MDGLLQALERRARCAGAARVCGHNAENAKREQLWREENAKYAQAEKVYTKEVSLQLIAEADRLQQLDREKKQRGERVKPVEEQADALHRKYGPANWRRTREQEQQEQQMKQRAAEQASAQSTGAPARLERRTSFSRFGTPGCFRNLNGGNSTTQRPTARWRNRTSRRSERSKRPSCRKLKSRRQAKIAPADVTDKSNPDIPPSGARNTTEKSAGGIICKN